MTGIPYVPEQITVHLGAPDSPAENVTLPFPDYIKNVASSELFPNWPESALRANIYAIISFTLNRIYTEWYRSRGYDFDITNTTQFDQAFVDGRNYFDSISQIVDEIFNDYLRRPGQYSPLFARYCNGTTSTCDGLSQWGSVDLAEQGYTPFEILTHYYGSDLELVTDAPILPYVPSYPGTPLSLGSEGLAVRTIQVQLNEIANTYSRIPTIPEVNGVFDEYTDAAVREFQTIFNLVVDGVVGKATWYRLSFLYVSLRRLAELDSLGILPDYLYYHYGDTLGLGDLGDLIQVLQYHLSVISEFNPYITPVFITGYFDDATKEAVTNFQIYNGLEPTGIVDQTTGQMIYDSYLGIRQLDE